MIFLYTIVSLLLLFLLLGFAPIKIYADYIETINLKVTFLFLKFNVFPNEKKDDNVENRRADAEGKKRKKDILSAVNEIIIILKSVFSKVVWLVKKIKITKLFARITVADKDAANTALIYGAVCSAVYPALGFLGTLTDISKSDVLVTSDFDAEEPKISFSGIASVRLIHVGAAAIGFLFRYIKERLANNNNMLAERK